MEFVLAAFLCIPAALRVRSQAVSGEGSPGRKKKKKTADASLIHPALLCGCEFKARFFVSLCVSSVFPADLTSLAFWTLEAGGVSGQGGRRGAAWILPVTQDPED